ncbi:MULTISPECIES: protein kinase domain-containing protein [Sorangium]|uniref:Protein kinase n=1 Tax=Sorangium cellulosum TaxID=56 RepID=A0A4P2QWP1_SORCE|nr:MULTISPECIES: protein kinase [Sorangium]AUX34591.1 protein kinase [Sorangium cellulosum]WCQ93903.1 serine-threonine kinase [Sorangium sp. Soce836]
MDRTLVDEGSSSRDPGVVPLPPGGLAHVPGDVLDRRYRLRVRLGRGGFGDVWRAEELLPDGAPFREVALKLLVSDFADAADWADEAKLLASFRHPSLVTIYAAGILHGAPRTPFVSMELLEGRNLADLIRYRRRIPWRRVVAWARDVAGALDVIHARGVVHLDLKPANLFLTQDGALKVLDFGISRRAGPSPGGPLSRAPGAPPAVSVGGGSGRVAGSDGAGGGSGGSGGSDGSDGDLGTAAFLAERDVYASTRRAFVGADSPAAARNVIGTPGFMAPEVLEMAEPSAATDAYALAVCIAQLTTGRLPHDVPDEPADGSDAASVSAWWTELRAATLRGAMRDLAADPARLPRGLLALLRRLLSVDPAHRRVAPGRLKQLLDEVWERPHGVPDRPYKGLAPLSATDEGLLFGRDDDLARLGRELEFEPCLVLQGPRGSGKSSLASAGLVPRLARRHADHKDDWIEARVSPEGDPDGALARTLAAVSPELETADLAALTRFCMASAVGVALVVDPIAALGEGRLAALVGALATGEARRGLRLIGVLDEADERAAALLATPAGEGLRAALRYVGLPAAAAVKDLVAGPARLAGAEVRGLAQVEAEVQRELRSGGAALSFVALALADWWATARDQRGALTGEAWRALGGVRGALARHADAAALALTPEDRAIADEALLRLGAVDGSRVRWVEAELVEAVGAPPADMDRVLGALERARLLVRRDLRVELAHEALVAGWPQLASTRALHMDRLILLERLREAADVWDRSGENPDFLLRRDLLDQVSAGAAFASRLPRREQALVRESLRRARRQRAKKLGAAAALGLAAASAFAAERWASARQASAEAARRAAEERADLAELIGKARRTEDPYHRAAWIAAALSRRADDAALPLDLATAAMDLPRAHFLTVDTVVGPALPWDDRWVVAGGPGGALLVADLRPPDPDVIDDVALDVDPESVPRIKTPRVIALRPHDAPHVERVPFAFDTAVATRSVTGEVRVFRLREDGTVALAAIAPVRCSSAVHAAEAAPVLACSTDGGIARWDLRRGGGAGAVDRHPFRGNVLGVSPDGARVAAVLGRRALLWGPEGGAGAEITLGAPAVLGRFSPRDPAIALVQQSRTSIYAFDRPEAPLLELDTDPAPASARWDAGGLDLGVCGGGGSVWHYLRKGGRAPGDPPPEGSPCEAPPGQRAPRPLRARGEAADIADRGVGPHGLVGGWRLPDRRVLTRDLILFSPGPPAAERFLRFEGLDPAGGAEVREPGASAAAVLRRGSAVAFQIGGEVRLYDEGSRRRAGAQRGHLLRACDDGRLLAYRKDEGVWTLFDAATGATVEAVPRAPALVLGVDAACRTLFTQELDGNLVATSLRDLSSRTIAVTDGYVYEARPSPARGGVGPGLWLAFSSGAVARIDEARGEVRVLGYATPRATAIADGPLPGDVAFADATGVVLVRRAGLAERVLEGVSGAEWEDLSVAPDGRTMLLASADRIAVLDLERREIVGAMPSDGRERLAAWDADGSVLSWSFGRVGGPVGVVVPRGLPLAQRVGEAVSNLRAEGKRLVARHE